VVGVLAVADIAVDFGDGVVDVVNVCEDEGTCGVAGPGEEALGVTEGHSGEVGHLLREGYVVAGSRGAEVEGGGEREEEREKGDSNGDPHSWLLATIKMIRW
jgi:hypothetical protein